MTTLLRVGLRSLLMVTTVLALWVSAALAHDKVEHGVRAMVRPGECQKEVGESSKKECYVDENCNQNKKCCPTARGGTVCRHPANNCQQLECRTCHTDFKSGLPTCVVNGKWGAWGPYGSCSVTCGRGIQVRNRACDSPAPAYGGTVCEGSATDSQECNLGSCPVNGKWGAWGPYGSCSVTCGQGIQVRSRACDSPAPAYGGTVCQGSATESQECNLGSCLVNGKWGAWGPYGCCSVTCGQGIQVRSRACDSPAPAYGGTVCQGSATDSKECNLGSCPVNGNWGAWGEYNACSVTCGGGQQERTRACDSPAPAYGGANCEGEDAETVGCNSNPCPVNGNWGAWGEYGACSVTCGVGVQERTRACDSPAPAYGGENCQGEVSETEWCNTFPCPVNGNWGAWGEYSACTVTCGGGLQG